jgi:hypothetical protein
MYGWKHNFIQLPMALDSCQNYIGVNGNHRKKWTSRICHGAAPIPIGLLAQQEAHLGLPSGTIAPPLVASRGCVPYLYSTFVYFQT